MFNIHSAIKEHFQNAIDKVKSYQLVIKSF